MKSFFTVACVLLAVLTRAQVKTFPYSESFEDEFINGHQVYFLPNWWANHMVADTMGQYDGLARSGNYSLYMNPEGEEFSTTIQVYLDLTGRYHNVAEFWAATRKNGEPEDQKRVKLNVGISYDGGKTFPFMTRFGPHEGMPNEDTDFQKFTFVFPPIVENQSDVVLKFSGKSGGGPHLPAILLLDDISVFQAAQDTFPPYIMGEELVINTPDLLNIRFSEPLLPESALLLSNYEFSWYEEDDGSHHTGESGASVTGEGPLPQVVNVELVAGGYGLSLTLDPPLTIGETYDLKLYNLTDLNGNTSEILTQDAIVFNLPEPGSLVISEVFFADPGPARTTSKLQFVEIYNPGTETIPLGGLRIKGAISAHDLPNVKLKPGEYWVATGNGATHLPTFGEAAWEWKGSWIEYTSEHGDPVEPQVFFIQTTNRHSGVEVDSIGFDFNDPAWSALIKAGRSIEVCNAFSDNLNPSNWVLADDTGAGYKYLYDGVEYTVYATPGSSCINGEAPVVDLGPDGTRCGIAELTLDAGNAGSRYLWSTGEETQTIKIITSGIYSVVVNNGVGASYDTIQVTFAESEPSFTASAMVPATACSATPVQFTDNSSGAVSWIWKFGDGNESYLPNPQHRYEDDGIFEVSLIATNGSGCVDVIHAVIEVFPNSVSWSLPSLICERTIASFVENSPAAISWFWDFGDGNYSEEQNPTNTYKHSGLYTVTLSVDNQYGCSSTVTEEIEVQENKMSWTASGPVYLCPGVDDQMEANEVVLYPNPGEGTFSIVMDSPGKGGILFHVVNSFGETVLAGRLTNGKGNIKTFDGSSLPEGQYLVRIQTDQGVISKKLFVR